jgi:hypothetical protein
MRWQGSRGTCILKPITLHHVLMLDRLLDASLACMTTSKLNSGATTCFSCTPVRLVRRRRVAELKYEIERQRPHMQRKTGTTSGWDIVSEEREIEGNESSKEYHTLFLTPLSTIFCYSRYSLKNAASPRRHPLLYYIFK